MYLDNQFKPMTKMKNPHVNATIHKQEPQKANKNK